VFFTNIFHPKLLGVWQFWKKNGGEKHQQKRKKELVVE
jgi:hypothetical protein